MSFLFEASRRIGENDFRQRTSRAQKDASSFTNSSNEFSFELSFFLFDSYRYVNAEEVYLLRMSQNHQR